MKRTRARSLSSSGLMIAAGAIGAAVWMNAEHAAAGPARPSFDPPQTLALSDIYTDAKASVEDKAAENRNAAASATVDNFLNSVEQAMDRPGAKSGDAAADCAYASFEQWARAGALTVEAKPYNRQGTVLRFQYLVGLEVLALKFRSEKFELDPDIMTWLHTLNAENLRFYERASNRGNLRVRAGAAAALHAVIEHDPASVQFQNQVWGEAIAAIRDDGSIEAELSRGKRATVYHIYSFAATLILRSAREALGYKETPQETARLTALANFIGRALCDPAEMAQKAHSTLEVPGGWAYGVVNGYGGKLLNADWSKCGHPEVPPRDRVTGGDSRRTAAILKPGGN
ncbi:MAG: alginate lyase family protein [Methylocella sp.]